MSAFASETFGSVVDKGVLPIHSFILNNIIRLPVEQ